LGHEAEHSPPSSAEVKSAWHYTLTPSISLWHGAWLITGTACMWGNYNLICTFTLFVGGIACFAQWYN